MFAQKLRKVVFEKLPYIEFQNIEMWRDGSPRYQDPDFKFVATVATGGRVKFLSAV